MDEIEIIEFVVDQVGAIHSRPPSQSTRVSGGGWPDVEISSDSFFFTRRALIVRSWSDRLCDAPASARFQPIDQALAKFAVWSIAARARPITVHSTKRLKRLERLENISLRIRKGRRLTFRLQAPVGILKPLRKSVLGCSQESRSRNQRGCTWLAISSSSCSASDTRRDSRSTQTVNRRCQISLENSHRHSRTNWWKTME